MNDDRQIVAESRHIFNFYSALLNSEVTAPKFRTM